MVVMIIMFSGATGIFSYYYLTGLLFDLYGVITSMYILIQYSLTILLIFIIMQFVVNICGNRTLADSDTQNKQGKASNAFLLNSPDADKKTSDLKYSDPDIAWKCKNNNRSITFLFM